MTSASTFSYLLSTSGSIPIQVILPATQDWDPCFDFVGYVGQWDLVQNLVWLYWECVRSFCSSCLGYHGQRDAHCYRNDCHHNDFRGAYTSTSTRSVGFVDVEGER